LNGSASVVPLFAARRAEPDAVTRGRAGASIADALAQKRPAGLWKAPAGKLADFTRGEIDCVKR